jgi:hypothetical protein
MDKVKDNAHVWFFLLISSAIIFIMCMGVDSSVKTPAAGHSIKQQESQGDVQSLSYQQTEDISVASNQEHDGNLFEEEDE